MPAEAGSGAQNVQVVKLAAEPPLFTNTTNDFTSLGLFRDAPNTAPIATNILVRQGDVIGILGSRGNVNSYGAGNYSTTINGEAVTLRRFGMQFQLATTDARDLWTESGGSISRVEMSYEPSCFTSAAPPSGTYGAAYSGHLFTVDQPETPNFTISAGSLPPGFSLDPATDMLSGTPTAAGSFTFTVSSGGLAGTKEVTLTIAKAALSVTAENASRVYGAENPSFTGSLQGLLPGDEVSATYSTTALATSDVGTYPITPSLTDPNSRLANYDLTSTDGTLTVTPAALTVQIHDKAVLSDEPLPALTYTTSGWVNNDTEALLTGSLNTTATETSAAGTYPITVGSLSVPNYQLASTPGTLTITDPAITISSGQLIAGRPVLGGSVTKGREVTVQLTIAGSSASAVVVYKLMPDANGQWVLDTATAIPASGTFPEGGIGPGMSVEIRASVAGGVNEATHSLSANYKYYLPLLVQSS